MDSGGIPSNSGSWEDLSDSGVSMKMFTSAAGLNLRKSRNQDVLQRNNRANELVDVKHCNVLHVSLVTTHVQKLWKCKDVEEFKQVFIDCLEYHHHAYEIMGHILDLDINENSVMVYRPRERGETDDDPDPFNIADKQRRARGVLIDFDLSRSVSSDHEGNTGYNNHLQHHLNMRPGTQVYFMARELMEKEPRLPLRHLYRYDLESFFYLLIWAATHYDFDRPRRHSAPHPSPRRSTPLNTDLEKWGVHAEAYNVKTLLRLKSVVKYLRSGWEDVWERWVRPLVLMFRDAHDAVDYADEAELAEFDRTTCDDRITFDKFMKTIGVTPRGLESLPTDR